MKRKVIALLCTIVIILTVISGMVACKPTVPKIGVVMGIGNAIRWEKEKQYMIDYAESNGAEIEVRLNKNASNDAASNTLYQDCVEVIDSGINVLLLTPRDGKSEETKMIVDYATSKKVKVISYARLLFDRNIDLFVGYDNFNIGYMMADYLCQTSNEGNYIVIQGSEVDENGIQIYSGVKKAIEKRLDGTHLTGKKIKIVPDGEIKIPNWEVDICETKVRECIINAQKLGIKIDGIIAPNDAFAGVCAKIVAELNLDKVLISGMDAELDALKRILNGTQTMTIHLELKRLAESAMASAIALVKGEDVKENSKCDNSYGKAPQIKARLIVGQMICNRENIQSIILNNDIFSEEEVFGEPTK